MKDTKIPIVGVPSDWTYRMRNGNKNEFHPTEFAARCHHKDDLPIVLEPPMKGLYAERIDGAWYWICGCEKCLGNFEKHSYVVCDEHNRCDSCAKHRSEFQEAVWGTRGGWRCNGCQDRISEEAKRAALAAAAEAGHSEYDCMNEDEIICPYCATKQSKDDVHEGSEAQECNTCGGIFALEVEYTISFTTKGVTPPEGMEAEEVSHDLEE